MKPSFIAMEAHYPKRAQYKRAELYKLMGWNDLITKSAFYDTCATRMSVALVSSGVSSFGPLVAKAGPLKGRSIETGQIRLSQTLRRQWGEPEIFRGNDEAKKGIGGRKGVVSFFRIHGARGGPGGHIDLVWPGENGFHACAMSCYFDAVEIWFWPLN